MELSRLAPPAADEGACREVRSVGGDFLPLHAWARRLERRDGRFLGSYVSIDSMDAKERLLLERSAREMNDVMARILPHPDAAGSGFRVGGFLNPRPSGSGDSFDVFRADGRSVGFYGLDVMGHGMMSALIAFSLHTLIPTIGAGCRGPAPSPEEVIRVLNEKFKNIGDRSASPFFTIAYGRIDTVTGQFSIARAGHIPVLHQSTAGAASYLETPGAAVGVFDELAVAAGCGVLEPGDRLFLASDGLLEAFVEDDVRAAKRKFSDFVVSNRSLGLDELSTRIYEFTARGRTGNTFIDDSSLLAIERTARKNSRA
jgi:sigma-B regulation protein RsbU (phosphoserine phosphatase)